MGGQGSQHQDSPVGIPGSPCPQLGLLTQLGDRTQDVPCMDGSLQGGTQECVSAVLPGECPLLLPGTGLVCDTHSGSWLGTETPMWGHTAPSSLTPQLELELDQPDGCSDTMRPP